GDVAGYLGETKQPALRIVNRVDHDIGEKFRAVLADAPTFPFIAALPGRDLDRPLRHAGLAVLFGVKTREVLADDLLRRISLDPLRARVPARDQPSRAQHVDCVIDDALHQQAELLLTLAQGFFRLAALGQIPRDLGKSDQ